jgi:DNA-binding GntR family transcriptional regulator
MVVTVTLCCVGIDHGAPEYLYLQLAALIREQISAGELRPRTAIPSLTDLAAEHDLAVVTVRKAIKVLVEEGLLVTQPGRGTYVAGKSPAG